jgi:flagellar biosynthetic protein FliP
VRGGWLALAALAVIAMWPHPAVAQSVNIDLGGVGGAGATSRLVQLTALITALSLAPSLLVMVTAFTRIIIVLSLLRNALGLQGAPPNMVLIGLALFLTFHVMEPTIDQSWTLGLQPMSEGTIDDLEGIRRASEPFRRFMLSNVRADDLQLFIDLAHFRDVPAPEATPWRSLVPGFLVSEMRRAFEIGFLIYLPFLVIDLVVASILMSLGMMMLPPNAISLPFKLIFFVLVDGWRLVAGSLVQSFVG